MGLGRGMAMGTARCGTDEKRVSAVAPYPGSHRRVAF
jgi:hypothetical protein